MTIYYLPSTNRISVGNSSPPPCTGGPPSWLPGITAITGAWLGSVIGRTGLRPSLTQQGMATLLGGLGGLLVAYTFEWPSFLG